MTPEQLAVERDALLEGGRTLEEAEAMQWAAEHMPSLVTLRAVLQLPIIAGAQSIMNADAPTSSIRTLTRATSGETP